MKAIVVREFGGPEVLRVEEVDPLEYASGVVIVRMLAAGVNPVETYRRAGTQGYRPELPYTPGSDGAGVVEEVRGRAPGIGRGMRVWVTASQVGTYAEYAACPPGSVHVLPKHLSFSQGACLGIPYGTAYRALFQRAGAKKGESVLVHGASGGVGLAAIQFARAAGMRVAGTAGTPRGRKLVLREGADAVFDHGDPTYAAKAFAWTKKAGFDVIVEMLANVNLPLDLELAARYGRIVVVGSRGQVTVDPREAMTRDASILGMSLRNATLKEQPRIAAAIQAGLEDKSLRPVVGREFPLERAADAHRAVMEPGAYGKIVLTLSPKS